MVLDPWIIVAGMLFIQPLIALLWAYLLVRGAVTFTTARISNQIDERVEYATEQLKE